LSHLLTRNRVFRQSKREERGHLKPAEHLKQNVSDFSQNAKRPTLPNDQMVQASFLDVNQSRCLIKNRKVSAFLVENGDLDQ